MDYPKKLVIATNNRGKLIEFEKLLSPLGVAVLSTKDFSQVGEIVENGDTFVENALIKARTLATITGCVSLADDSGLEVDFLNGLPGVNSARFAGEPKSDEKNNQKLLHLMQNVPMDQRRARFKCAIAIVTPDKKETTVLGVCQGYILDQPVGEGGFGYDPLFYMPEYKKTFAQLDIETKNHISHRGEATRQALGILKEIFE